MTRKVIHWKKIVLVAYCYQLFSLQVVKHENRLGVTIMFESPDALNRKIRLLNDKNITYVDLKNYFRLNSRKTEFVNRCLSFVNILKLLQPYACFVYLWKCICAHRMMW